MSPREVAEGCFTIDDQKKLSAEPDWPYAANGAGSFDIKTWAHDLGYQQYLMKRHAHMFKTVVICVAAVIGAPAESKPYVTLYNPGNAEMVDGNKQFTLINFMYNVSYNHYRPAMPTTDTYEFWQDAANCDS